MCNALLNKLKRIFRLEIVSQIFRKAQTKLELYRKGWLSVVSSGTASNGTGRSPGTRAAKIQFSQSPTHKGVKKESIFHNNECCFVISRNVHAGKQRRVAYIM